MMTRFFLLLIGILVLFTSSAGARLASVSGTPDPSVDEVAAGGNAADVAISLAHGFPLWYQDEEGRKLELCLEQAVEKSPASGGGFFKPCLTAEPIVSNPISFPSNFGTEAFYWAGIAQATFTSTQDGLPSGGGDALLVLSQEASFLNGLPTEGEQIVFGRTRLRINVPVPGTYRVTYPFGTRDYVVEVVDGGREINQTQDIGIVSPQDFLVSLSDGPVPPAPPAPAPPRLDEAIVNLDGRSIGPFLEGNPSDRLFDAAGNQYLSDPGTDVFPLEIPIQGVNGTDYFEIRLLESPSGSGTIPAGFLLDGTGDIDGTADNAIRITNFRIAGKVFNDGPNLPPVANPDFAVTSPGEAVLIDVSANDTDVVGIDPSDPFNPGNPANTNVHGLHPHALGIVSGGEIVRSTPLTTTKGATVRRITNLLTGKASFLYTPLQSDDALGEDTFTYVIQDKGGLVSAPATVTVTVEKLAVEKAEYRPRTGRWQIRGTTSDRAGNSVTLHGEVRATLSGSAEVPPVNSTAAGSAAMRVADSGIDLFVQLDPPPVSAVTSVRIHVVSPEAKDPFIFIPFNSATQGAFSGTLNRTLNSINLISRPAAGIVSFEDAIRAILDGRAFLRVSTVINPGGEIRGLLARPVIGVAPVAADGTWQFSGKSTAVPGAFGTISATSANGILVRDVPLRLR